MQRFLDEHPEFQGTHDLLESISQQTIDDTIVHHNIDPDDMKLYKYINKSKLYERREVNDYLSLVLEDILKREKMALASTEVLCNEGGFMRGDFSTKNLQIEKLRNKLYENKKEIETLADNLIGNTETKILSLFLNKKVFFDDFKEKLFFLKNFRRFKNQLEQAEDNEFALQDLFYQSKTQSQLASLDQINNRITQLEGDKMTVYFYFLSPLLTTQTKLLVFDKLKINYKHLVLETLEEEEAYKKIASTLIGETPKNKIIFLNSIEIKDKLRVYYFLTRHTINNRLEAKALFRQTLDILKILPLENKFGLLVLVGWVKTFLYYKNIDEGLKLYKKLVTITGREGVQRVAFKNYPTGEHIEHDVSQDMNILSEFFNSVIQYKETNVLDFGLFVSLAKQTEDNNAFSPFKWEEVVSLYE